MLDPNGIVRTDWPKLVEAADLLGMYPGSLYRRWRYGQLPEGVCVKIDNTLYFNRAELERIRSTSKSTKGQRRRLGSEA